VGSTPSPRICPTPIGAATGEVVECQLSDRPHPEHGYRACLGLRELARRFGPERLEAACQQALTLGTSAYPRIRSILECGLKQACPEPRSSTAEASDHANIRGAAYYTTEPN
jgi:hypothetical protein